MNGSITSEFGNLTLLELLDLGANSFVGTVPTSIANLPLLSKFQYTYVGLAFGEVSSVSEVLSFAVASLRVYGNDLTGSLDEFCTIWDEPDVSKALAANTCGQADDIECPCCNQCCNVDIFECRPVN